jgi:microcystin-dependent protein
MLLLSGNELHLNCTYICRKELDSAKIDSNSADFEAEKIQTVKNILKNSHDFSSVNKKLKEAGATGGYGGFTAEANFKSDEEVNLAVKDTFDHEWEGDYRHTIPKTVNVYQLNASVFDSKHEIREVYIKPEFSSQLIQVQRSSASIVTPESFDDALGSYTTVSSGPIGTIIAYAGCDNTKIPSNYLICDGSFVSCKEYPDLYAHLGESSGRGDGTFGLPDLRGRTIIGEGQGKGLTTRAHAEMGGEESHTLTVNELPDHKLKVNTSTGTLEHWSLHEGHRSPTDGLRYPPSPIVIETESLGANEPHNNMQPYCAIMWVIRAV